MKRAMLAVCAMGGVMLLLIGCKSLDLGLDLALTGVDAAANVRLLDGSPDVVAVDLQNKLKSKRLRSRHLQVQRYGGRGEQNCRGPAFQSDFEEPACRGRTRTDACLDGVVGQPQRSADQCEGVCPD